MSDPDEDPTPPDSLPEELVRAIDSLDPSELEAALSYVGRRLEDHRTPIEKEIEATAAGEVLKIVDREGDTLVRKHPPNPDGPGVDTERVSLYQVQRERQVDGTESLHWSFLGDVHDWEEIRCSSCGGALDADADVCPHCGSETTDDQEAEE